MALSAVHQLSGFRHGAQEPSVFRENLQNITGPLLDTEEPLSTLLTPFGTLPYKYPCTTVTSRPRVITGRPPRGGKATRGTANGDEAYWRGSRNPFYPH